MAEASNDDKIREAIERGMAGLGGGASSIVKEIGLAGFAITDRLAIGGNHPPLGEMISEAGGDFAEVTTASLKENYGDHIDVAEKLLAEARDLPKVIEDQSMKDRFTSLIKKLRDHAKALGAFHAKEKQPYLRGGQAVDQFFFGPIGKLSRRNKTDNPGAADVLNNRLTEYDNKVLEEERRARQRAADEAARIAREAREKAEREAAEEARKAREAEEARLAAERARNPERKEEKAAVAETAQAAVADQGVRTDAAAVTAAVTTAKAQEAHVATLATSADIMRNRNEKTGVLSTMGQEKFAEIVDYVELEKAMTALWSHISAEAKQKAVTSFARSTDWRQPLAGCSIGRRNRSVVR